MLNELKSSGRLLLWFILLLGIPVGLSLAVFAVYPQSSGGLKVLSPTVTAAQTYIAEAVGLLVLMGLMAWKAPTVNRPRRDGLLMIVPVLNVIVFFRIAWRLSDLPLSLTLSPHAPSRPPNQL